jgi:hypothetical protein
MTTVGVGIVGIGLAALALALLAIPGFLIGGAVGLVAGRVGVSRRALWIAIVGWVAACLAVGIIVALQVSAEKPDGQQSIGVAFYLLLGVASSVGGGYGLLRGAIPSSRNK